MWFSCVSYYPKSFIKVNQTKINKYNILKAFGPHHKENPLIFISCYYLGSRAGGEGRINYRF